MKSLFTGIVLGCCLICGSVAASGPRAGTGTNYADELRSTPLGPIRLGSARGSNWAEYCPDETCDVIRTRRPIERNTLAGLALSYFYYVSDYEYLHPWKENNTLRDKVDAFLQVQSIGECGAAVGRERAICVLRSLGSTYDLEILFIRHDEGRTSVQKLSRDEQLK